MGLGSGAPSAPTTTTTGTTVTYGSPGEPHGTIPAAALKAQSHLAPGAGQPTPQAALERYAVVWGTWDSTSLAAVQTRVAQMSLGAARDEAQQAVASYQADTTLQHSTMSSSTAVVAVAQGVGSASGYWVVTTTEKTGSGQVSGLPPTFHVTYAKLTHTASGWVVNTWSPQS